MTELMLAFADYGKRVEIENGIYRIVPSKVQAIGKSEAAAR
jgi:hypothetical protein